jgi:formate transporter
MSFFSPKEIVSQVRQTAGAKAGTSTSSLAMLSILGGAYVAFGGLLAVVVGGGMPEMAAANPGLQKFLFGSVFPIGLILVILAGAELFTSSCAVMTVGVMTKERRLKELLKVWGVGYLFNFVGSLLVVLLIGELSGILNTEPWKTTTIAIGEAKVAQPFWQIFAKGIGANWLVCLAAWLAFAAKDTFGKILGIWFPVMTFVALGFEHSIANMFFIPMAMNLGADISWLEFFWKNLLPATLGNIVGGSLMVGLPYWYCYGRENKVEEVKEIKEVKEEVVEEELVEVK